MRLACGGFSSRKHIFIRGSPALIRSCRSTVHSGAENEIAAERRDYRSHVQVVTCRLNALRPYSSHNVKHVYIDTSKFEKEELDDEVEEDEED